MRLVSLILFRALFLIGALQISGVAHVAADAVSMISGEAHANDSDDDCDESTCPPGCATCHHQHTGVTPPVPPTAEVAAITTREILSAPYQHLERSPSQREIAPPDRPPRSHG